MFNPRKNPYFPRPRNPPIFGDGDKDKVSNCLGKLLGRGELKVWGYLGDYPPKTPIFGVGGADRTTKRFGDSLGVGKLRFWGFFGVKSPQKNEDFPTTIKNL